MKKLTLKNISEDENPALVFVPFSPKHNERRCIVIKNIHGKDTLMFNSSSNDISESEKKVSKTIAGYYVSNTSSPVDSAHSGDERINIISDKNKNMHNDEMTKDLSDDIR